jgi:hypothetical protein
MVGDFDSATDHIQHRAGRLAMHKLLEVLGADRNRYATNFVDLLLSPRVLEEDGVVTITNSGCLMGEPGTKIVLTFLALVANCYARRGIPSKLFATAGDDQIDADDDKEELLRYAEASKITTMVPSSEKWGIFEYSAIYCQQLLNIEEDDPLKAEIAIPKPRLLSPETKSGRGDTDTNPAYGKSSQFAKEYEWCPYDWIKNSMILLFLRNMKTYIELDPIVFLPREWGGLGLPGIPASSIAQLLPDWHKNLISHRERGDRHAKQALSAWSTTRIMHRGLLEPETDEYDLLLTEFLPTATFDQIEIDCHPRLRYREKLKMAADQGWIPLDEVLNIVKDSQTYANIWDINAEVSRGFASVKWSKRSERLEKISEKFPLSVLDQFPDKPSWQPGLLALVSGVYGLSEYSASEREELGLEEGEILPKVVPMMGTHASPRLFLHYDNNRLILHTTSRQQAQRKRPFV